MFDKSTTCKSTSWLAVTLRLKMAKTGYKISSLDVISRISSMNFHHIHIISVSGDGSKFMSRISYSVESISKFFNPHFRQTARQTLKFFFSLVLKKNKKEFEKAILRFTGGKMEKLRFIMHHKKLTRNFGGLDIFIESVRVFRSFPI